MEAPEVPTEHLHEQINESAEHAEHAGHGDGGGGKWIMGVALSSAIIAAFAALASLLAGANANLAMINQMKASDQWNYYQAKGVKSNVLKSKVELLAALGKPKGANDQKKLEQYDSDQKGISKKAQTLEGEARERLEIHESMAKSVTMFQVAIAIAAISALTRKRVFWYVGLLASLVGLVLFTGALKGHLRAEATESAEEAAEKAEAAKEEAGAHAEKSAGKGEAGEKSSAEAKHAKPEKSPEGAAAEKPSHPEAAAPEASHEPPSTPRAEHAPEPTPAHEGAAPPPGN